MLPKVDIDAQVSVRLAGGRLWVHISIGRLLPRRFVCEFGELLLVFCPLQRAKSVDLIIIEPKMFIVHPTLTF